MTGPQIAVGPAAEPSAPTSRGQIALLVYAVGGGIVWWMLHLTVGAALVQGVCNGVPRWWLTVNNVVCAVGVATALGASFAIVRPTTHAAAVTRRARFIGFVAIAANVFSLALVLLESLPVYLLGSCS